MTYMSQLRRPASRPLALTAQAGLVAAVLTATSVLSTAAARADAVAYLVNVTVRPGYNFANADAALDYGHGTCAKVDNGEPYSAVMSDVSTDFNTSDDYQAAYLINQAVNELCPQFIWQLRRSAAGYQLAAK